MVILTTNLDNTAGVRILLVDNEVDNTLVLSICLEDEGYKVDAFNDPALALSSFRPNYYSLVILDINMPQMNGYDLYNEIRKLDNNVKACLMTASELYNTLKTPPDEILRHTKCFISKPIDLDELVREIKNVLD
jgi:DNA-binding NtrC family response regulator